MTIDIKQLTHDALLAAYAVHEQLGEDGEQEVRTNDFGDTALRADIECEAVVLETLRRSGLNITVHSEEHGVVTIGAGDDYFAVLDGIDGSSNYKDGRGVKGYGTMFAIFHGQQPKYSDYIACAVMMHAASSLYIASKGDGAFVVSGEKSSTIHTSSETALTTDLPVYIDEYFQLNRDLFSKPLAGYNTRYTKSSAQSYADLAAGSVSLVLECTRKGNLEIAVSYGLIHEAGGVTLDVDGNDIGKQSYLEYGQSAHVPVVSAANVAVAKQLMAILPATK